MIVLYVLIALTVVFLLVVAMRPAEFRITRSATIGAPPAVVFAQVNELRKWDAWSPWIKLDPDAKSVFEGPAAGVGSVMSWSGNNKIGEGRMSLIESRPSELVRFKLEFVRPMQATNLAEFTFQPDGGQTVVTWSMSEKIISLPRPSVCSSTATKWLEASLKPGWRR